MLEKKSKMSKFTAVQQIILHPMRNEIMPTIFDESVGRQLPLQITPNPLSPVIIFQPRKITFQPFTPLQK